MNPVTLGLRTDGYRWDWTAQDRYWWSAIRIVTRQKQAPGYD